MKIVENTCTSKTAPGGALHLEVNSYSPTPHPCQSPIMYLRKKCPFMSGLRAFPLFLTRYSLAVPLPAAQPHAMKPDDEKKPFSRSVSGLHRPAGGLFPYAVRPHRQKHAGLPATAKGTASQSSTGRTGKRNESGGRPSGLGGTGTENGGVEQRQKYGTLDLHA